MRRWHFYVMGAIALLYGLISVAEYVMISYGLQAGWLDLYPEDQIAWLSSLPAWIHGVWGAHAVLAIVGALCLLAHLRASVWMLAFSFLTMVVLAAWAVFVADPSIIALAGGGGMPWFLTGLLLLLLFLVYIYARQEKRAGEVL